MIDLDYQEPELVALYDLFNGWDLDRDYYAELPEIRPSRILDVGCGTGLLARRFAANGHDVTGLDPAQAMLDFAKTAPHGDQVVWVCSAIAEYDAEPFDLIYMTGHAFQCMLHDDEIAAFMRAACRLLRSGGRLVFETRNPDFRAWEDWVPEKSTVTKTLPDGRVVTRWHEVDEVVDGRVSFRSFYQFSDKRLLSKSTLRFASLADLQAAAADAALTITEIYGDWNKSPLGPDRPEIIMTLQRR